MFSKKQALNLIAKKGGHSLIGKKSSHRPSYALKMGQVQGAYNKSPLEK
jgi:hypothetical protein